MTFLQFVYGLAGQAVLLAALGWLIRMLITNSLARDAAEFQARLQLDNEAFRSRLEMEAHRQATVFTRLHEQRAEVIAEVYKLLAIAERALRSMVTPFQMYGEDPYSKKMNSSALAIMAFQEGFEQARIWFALDTCNKADAVLTELRGIHNHFTIIVHGGSTAGEKVANAEEWGKAWDRVESKFQPLKTALEDEFRALLGVEANATAT
jgi:hypothetical protein